VVILLFRLREPATHDSDPNIRLRKGLPIPHILVAYVSKSLRARQRRATTGRDQHQSSSTTPAIPVDSRIEVVSWRGTSLFLAHDQPWSMSLNHLVIHRCNKGSLQTSSVTNTSLRVTRASTWLGILERLAGDKPHHVDRSSK
jgi:hypothetical protein